MVVKAVQQACSKGCKKHQILNPMLAYIHPIRFRTLGNCRVTLSINRPDSIVVRTIATLLSSCPASSCSASSSLNFSPRVVSRWRSSAELMKPFPSWIFSFHQITLFFIFISDDFLSSFQISFSFFQITDLIFSDSCTITSDNFIWQEHNKYLVKVPEAFNEVIAGISGAARTYCLKIVVEI